MTVYTNLFNFEYNNHQCYPWYELIYNKLSIILYNKFHANIHIWPEVIEILNFQWRPFKEILNGCYQKNQVTCPHISNYLIYNKFPCKYMHM